MSVKSYFYCLVIRFVLVTPLLLFSFGVSCQNKFLEFNKICLGESGLILNSVEISTHTTLVRMTFINMNLMFGDSAYIYSVIGDEKQSFYIEDVNSSKKLFVEETTIGKSIYHPTYIKIGEAKAFTLYFPPITDFQAINIKEGMVGSTWSFFDLRLDKTGTTENIHHYDSSIHNVIDHLAHLRYSDAMTILNILLSSQSKNDDFTHSLAGVVSYVLKDQPNAIKHFERAAELNPNNSSNYCSLFYLNWASGDADAALDNISTAIKYNDDNPELFQARGDVYFDKKQWENAIFDYNICIEKNKKLGISHDFTHFRRGISKFMLKDKSACKDFETAIELAPDERKTEVTLWYEKYCF